MLKIGKFYKFFEQVKQELTKVTWLNSKELFVLVSLVLVVVSVFSLICLFVDYGLSSFVQLLINLRLN